MYWIAGGIWMCNHCGLKKPCKCDREAGLMLKAQAGAQCGHCKHRVDGIIYLPAGFIRGYIQ